MKPIRTILMFTSLFAIISCNNDDNGVSLSDRSQALLGQWEYQSIMSDRAVDLNGDGTVNIDLYNTQELRQCLKDNLTFFTEMGETGKGSYRINENGLSCDNQEPFTTIEEDSYELIDNSIIRFQTRNEMRILELSKTKLIIETDDILDSENVLVTTTFTKN